MLFQQHSQWVHFRRRLLPARGFTITDEISTCVQGYALFAFAQRNHHRFACSVLPILASARSSEDFTNVASRTSFEAEATIRHENSPIEARTRPYGRDRT